MKTLSTPIRFLSLVTTVLFCLVFCCIALSSQAQIINGLIQNQNHEPLSEVSILIKDKKIGTISDSLGRFEIAAELQDTLLLVYQNHSMLFPIKDTSAITILWKWSQKNQVQQESLFDAPVPTEPFGATEFIDASRFNPIHITDPAQLIMGKTGGLQLSRPDGDPTAAFDLRLRGFSTFFEQYQPMVLVDGVPEANLQFIDPAEIASVHIIKDLATASFYGVRAGNGLVAIQTKKPEEGLLNLSYQTYAAYSTPKATVDMLATDEYLEALHFFSIQPPDFDGDTDWQQAILRKQTFSHAHQLAFSGRSDNFEYRTALSYKAVQGIVQQSGYEQIGARLFLAYQAPTSRWKLSNNTILTSRSFQNFDYDFGNGITAGPQNAPLLFATQLIPTMPIWKENNPDIGTYFDPGESFSPQENPVARLNKTINEGNRTYLINTTQAKYSISQSLRFIATYGLIYDELQRGFQSAPDVRLSPAALRTNAGILSQTEHKQHWFDTQLHFEKQWAKQQLQLLAGYSQQFNQSKNQRYFSDELPQGSFNYQSLDEPGRYPSGFVPFTDQVQSNRRIISYFASAAYQYDALFIAANARVEGASNLGHASKWYSFYGIQTGYDLATLWGNFPLITRLRLRIGYGVAGNLPAGNDKAQDKVGQSEIFSFSASSRTFFLDTNQNQAGNPDLGPEISKEINVGIDASLFNNRLHGSLDIFRKRTKEIISRQTFSTSAGGKTQFVNIGQLTNFGADGHLVWDVFRKEKFKWNLGITGSVHIQTVNQTTNDTYNTPTVINAGSTAVSLINSTGFILKAKRNNGFGSFIGPEFVGIGGDGQIIVADINGDGAACFCTDDTRWLGTARPRLVFGFSNNFQLGAFDLGFQVRGALGHSIFNSYRFFYMTTDAAFAANLYRGVTEEPINRLFFNPRFSDFYLEKGHFATLDYLSFGYSFPLKSPSFISKLRLYTSINNWLTWTNYSGLSPEPRFSRAGNNLDIGIDGPSAYYPEKSILLGLEVNF